MRERLKQLFETAVELSPAAREGFLDGACEPALRDQIARLLRAHDRAGDLLEHPAELAAEAATDPLAADDELQPGQRIGAFTLVERLGRGGFGSVWRASQEQPVVRDVALKVLHSDFGDPLLTERFLAECRLLARLQHAAVAKVFDAGAAPSGQPWIAMELIEGEPITRYCEAAALGWRQRVELLVETCEAVQHAHHKGVVHRDLKPSNVLVTRGDGRPRPVVIDFGVARDLDEGDRGRELEATQLLGTLDYMSPEQAAGSGDAIDTRTDVYALGVLLYELVARQRPFGREHEGEPPQALLDRIRRQAPPPPRRRDSAVARAPRELDWIALRAMAKDPDERYQSAAELAQDLQRLLAGEAVVAAGPGACYRCRKFAWRNRLPVALALALLVSLAVGVVVAASGWAEASAAAELAQQAERLARSEQAAAERESQKANRALDLLDQLWDHAHPSRLGHPDPSVRELIAAFERGLPTLLQGEPEVELRVRATLGRMQRVFGALDRADLHAARAVELAAGLQRPAALVDPLVERAMTLFDRGEVDPAAAAAERALAILGEPPADPAQAASALTVVARCRLRRGDADGALLAAERALAHRRGGGLDGVVDAKLLLANLHGTVGRVSVAMAMVEEALDQLAAVDAHHPLAIQALQHLAILQQRAGDLDAAEASHRECLRRRRALFGDDHPQVAWAEADLAWLLHTRGRDADAVILLERALPVLRQRLGEEHPYVSEAMQRLGTALAGCGRIDEAEPLLEEAVRRFGALPGHSPQGLVASLGNLAALQWQRGARQLARDTMAEAVRIARRELPVDDYVVSVNLTNLALMLAQLGERQQAAELLEDALQRSVAAGRLGDAELQRQHLEQLRSR